MPNLECLNPKDVLEHLNSLGYHDISPMQLKDFIHDLRKLIKYEQKQALQSSISPQSPVLRSDCDCSSPEFDNSSGKLSSNESYCDSVVSSCSTSATYSRRNSKPNESSKDTGRNTMDSYFGQKAHTSFIRPWNLQGCKEVSARGKKNPDPVRLYHQYKEFWKSQHIPGETKHLELRWVIRNKMLGQEPHPRVCI